MSRHDVTTWASLSRRVLLAALAAAFCLFACMPAFAFADDGDDEDDSNLINPQQRPDSSFIYDSSIVDLSNADSYYDKQTVQITGEAVGDIIDARDGMVWVTLAEASSSSNASVAVLMTRESASHIDTLGRYGTTGTMLQVRGVFHLACPEDQGLSDVHATSVAVVTKGVHHANEFRPEAFAVGAALTVVGFTLMGLFRYLRERQR